MNRLLHRTAAAFCISAALAGCSGFLDADRATTDPNLPSAPTRDQLYVGAQAALFAQQEGLLAMIACQWMQQCAGINGRFVQEQDNYNVTALTFDVQFSEIYSAGGLIALRAIQAGADEAGDPVYKGKAQVLEALLIGTAADIWGDLPYSEALGDEPNPAFDGQMAIYAALQTLLDQAITNLQGTGPGPEGTGVDLIGGTRAAWVQAANTLKARYHLHTAERLGDAAYTAARAAALNGISTQANNFRSAHSSVTSERNLWRQFQVTSGFGQDLVAGRRLVDLMNAQSDPRRAEYFALNENDAYGGFDVTTGTTDPDDISGLSGSGRDVDDFRQPLITWEENQLILAETNLRLSGILAAQPFLDAVKDAHGKLRLPATLQNIIEEKYISLFQNIEVWSDWKRTCFPTLTPALDADAIPGRLFYGDTEEQTNENTPPSSAQNLFTVRNFNDPSGC